MTPETIFTISNLVAAAGWLVLMLAPRNRQATTAARTLIPILLSVGYFGLVALHWGGTRGGFSSLHAVSDLFSNDWLLLAGWIHYLAFDLLVGAWEADDAAARGISRWIVIPCLLLTFLFGPIGWLSYNVIALRSS
jgi:ABA4-like protein